MKKSQPSKPVGDLPPDVKASDTKYPAKPLAYAVILELGLRDYSLSFYRVKGMGWVLLTLGISGAGKSDRNSTARSYGTTMEGKVCRVGRGPHVEKEATVYLSEENLPRLRKYVDLLAKGLADAGQIRDRISSRRAQGQLHRAAGRSSWTWLRPSLFFFHHVHLLEGAKSCTIGLRLVAPPLLRTALRSEQTTTGPEPETNAWP